VAFDTWLACTFALVRRRKSIVREAEGEILKHPEPFQSSLIHILYVYVCINLGMEARVLHAECQEEQLEVDPQIVAPDVTQLQEDLSPIAPLVQNMLAKKRSRGVDSVRDISAGLASRHRFCLVSRRANGQFRLVPSTELVFGRIILLKIVTCV